MYRIKKTHKALHTKINIMKLLSAVVLFSVMAIHLQAQIISGKVLDASSAKPLEYVSLGVIDTHLGIVSNEKGEFSIDVKGQSSKAQVRVSMIGYKSQTFSIEDLANKENILKLETEPVQLGEVTVKPFSGKLKKAGTTGYTSHGGRCGWGGTQKGQGYEIGTKIELGTSPVLIRSLHVCLYRQSFESSLFRLHIRNIVNNLPSQELLTENILLPLTKSSGWIDIDLKKYNLVFNGDIALTLEWVNVTASTKSKLIKVNNKQEYCVLFYEKQKQGGAYTKWGSESKWIWKDGSSPCFYLTVHE